MWSEKYVIWSSRYMITGKVALICANFESHLTSARVTIFFLSNYRSMSCNMIICKGSFNLCENCVGIPCDNNSQVSYFKGRNIFWKPSKVTRKLWRKQNCIIKNEGLLKESNALEFSVIKKVEVEEKSGPDNWIKLIRFRLVWYIMVIY